MELSSGLLRDIGKLYFEANDYNLQITVGGVDESIERETFKAHSVILRARSTYFQNLFSNDQIKKDGEWFTFEKSNIHPDVFRLLLEYIYTGICDLKEPDMQDLFIPLLLSADELSLTDLVKYIQSHIIDNEQSWLHDNFVHIFHVTTTHSTTFSLLANHCSQLICENPSLLFGTPSFIRLGRCSLLTIIKRDDLDLSEVDIWKYLLQWAINQHPLLNTSGDADSWTKKDFMELENRLKDFLPYIRFFQIPGDKLYEFVWPFKKILPKKLKAQLTQFHMMPNTELPPLGINYNLSLRLPKHNIESLYVTSKHAAMLNAWINMGENGIKNRDKVEFQLLLRGSRDGMDVKTFHELCDNKGPTLVLVKVLVIEVNNICGSDDVDSCDSIHEDDLNEICNSSVLSNSTSHFSTIRSNASVSVIGGYNPLSWSSSDTYLQTSDSFIFSFANSDTCEQDEYILSRVQNSRYSIRDMSCKLNNVGFGHDLWWFSGSCTQQYYEKKILPPNSGSTFIMNDYEVFQVINSREELYVEENESINWTEVKSSKEELSNGQLFSVKNLVAIDTYNESDGSVLNVGEDTKSFKSEDNSLENEVLIM
ncbi:164_t:CDS:2 [Funneliformis mosseae]|uniref:164_t:CDS:1 n=1 Tax=Funneliformis mosseae TaxID=27381 RepID=A0A9N8VEZ8_FUNMO|nr:164_t:CDS:2 [Funneliformis mosseae]